MSWEAWGDPPETEPIPDTHSFECYDEDEDCAECSMPDECECHCHED